MRALPWLAAACAFASVAGAAADSADQSAFDAVAQQVAFGRTGDDFPGGVLHRGDGPGGAVAGHGDRLRGGGFALRRDQLFGAQERGFQGKNFHDAIGQRAHDLLLIGQPLHVALRRHTGGE